MTIKSDLVKQVQDFNYDATVVSWFKHSKMKMLTIMSLGFFWDFRNEKSSKENEKFIDDILQLFVDDIDELFICKNGCYLEHRVYKEKFWIANKYYAWSLENTIERGNYNLSVRQISKLNKILTFIEKRDNVRSSIV